MRLHTGSWFFCFNEPMRSHLQMLACRVGFALERKRRTIGIRLFKGAMRRVLAPCSAVVRIRSGLAQGMRLRLNLPEEAAYWDGAREEFTQKTIASVLQSGMIVYDVGAHIGSMALGMARLTGTNGRVFAFEADPANIACLHESRDLNGLGNRLEVVPAAVWSRCSRDKLVFRCGARRRSHGGVEDDGCVPVAADGRLIEVAAVTLDDFVRAGNPPPAFIKIDVEGGEFHVLQGGETLFKTARPKLTVEVHHQRALESISTWLQTYNYAATWYVPSGGFPRVLFAWPAEGPAVPNQGE